MIKKSLSSLAMCLGLFFIHSQNGLAQTTYPLFGNARPNPPYTAEDIKIIGENFHYLRGKLSKSLIDALHQVNPNLKTIAYYDSSTFGIGVTAYNTEKLYRKDIAMSGAAKLVSNIDALQTQFKLAPLIAGAPVPLKRSTTLRDYSIDTSEYVIWFRIDNELMKIINFNLNTNEVEVSRGFSATSAREHKINALVFSPVYLGDAYPDGKDIKKRIRYGIDITSHIGRQVIIDRTYNAITKEYFDGLVIDTFNALSFNHVNMFGKKVNLIWDFNKHEYSTNEKKRAKQEIRLNEIQNELRNKLSKWPFLLANTMNEGQYWPGTGNIRRLLQPTDLKPRPLDGYSIENFAGRSLGPGKKPAYMKGKAWRDQVKMLMDAAQRGLSALPLAQPVGR